MNINHLTATEKTYGCPRCGGQIPNNVYPGAYCGAISRLDNKTEICSGCGTDEALEDYSYGYVVDWMASK